MLTDIFSNRYVDVILWEAFEEKDRRFLVQAFRIVSEQLYPYWTEEGNERFLAKAQVAGDPRQAEHGAGLGGTFAKDVFLDPRVAEGRSASGGLLHIRADMQALRPGPL
jgi:hypothetical protein